MNRKPKELSITFDLSSRYSDCGVQFSFDQEELNGILSANGYSEIEYFHEGPCGMTDYYRDAWYTTDTKGERHNAKAVFREIFKSNLKKMLTGSAE